MSKKSTKTGKQAESKTPAALNEVDLSKVQGGGGTAQGLLGHELTHATETGYNPKEISIDKSVPWNKN